MIRALPRKLFHHPPLAISHVPLPIDASITTRKHAALLFQYHHRLDSCSSPYRSHGWRSQPQKILASEHLTESAKVFASEDAALREKIGCNNYRKNAMRSVLCNNSGNYSGAQVVSSGPLSIISWHGCTGCCPPTHHCPTTRGRHICLASDV
jgi:hypothetical protein